MRSRQFPQQYKISLSRFSLEKRIGQDHILQNILERIDLDLIYQEVPYT